VSAATRVFHVNVNCSDLDASLAWYRSLGLRPTVRTAPTRPQPGGAFGLDAVQWDAWILAGGDGYDAPVLDLLEWQVPGPGRPVGDGGFRRLRLGCTDRRAVEPASDPDGTRLTLEPADRPAVRGVTVACRDVAASRAFYEAALGLQALDERTLADDRGPAVFTVELEPTDGLIAARAANDLGICRLACTTGDLDADAARLDALGARRYSDPAALDMGPDLPPLRALFFADPDGTTLELIEPPGTPTG
jgi:catechol 2,3-dioxygenase-like lactoylglutathione lyase family enzyme